MSPWHLVIALLFCVACASAQTPPESQPGDAFSGNRVRRSNWRWHPVRESPHCDDVIRNDLLRASLPADAPRDSLALLVRRPVPDLLIAAVSVGAEQPTYIVVEETPRGGWWTLWRVMRDGERWIRAPRPADVFWRTRDEVRGRPSKRDVARFIGADSHDEFAFCPRALYWLRREEICAS